MTITILGDVVFIPQTQINATAVTVKYLGLLLDKPEVQGLLKHLQNEFGNSSLFTNISVVRKNVSSTENKNLLSVYNSMREVNFQLPRSLLTSEL